MKKSFDRISRYIQQPFHNLFYRRFEEKCNRNNDSDTGCNFHMFK